MEFSIFDETNYFAFGELSFVNNYFVNEIPDKKKKTNKQTKMNFTTDKDVTQIKFQFKFSL